MSGYALSQLEQLVTQALLIIGLVTVIVLPWLIKARDRTRIHETLSKALERGVAPPPELLKAITENSRTAAPARPLPEKDLRTGVIWLSVAAGLGLLALGIVLGHDPKHLHLPIRQPLASLAIAAFPGAIGLGYLILWLIGRRETP
jgi:Mg2+/citrate symporter